jgi:hypothetical protein
MLFKKSEREKLSWSLRGCVDNIKIDATESECELDSSGSG